MRSFDVVEIHGLLVSEAAIYYTLLLGENGAALVLSDFKELNEASADVRDLYSNARKIVSGRKTPK